VETQTESDNKFSLVNCSNISFEPEREMMNLFIEKREEFSFTSGMSLSEVNNIDLSKKGKKKYTKIKKITEVIDEEVNSVEKEEFPRKNKFLTDESLNNSFEVKEEANGGAIGDDEEDYFKISQKVKKTKIKTKKKKK
jgi:hypothetical protein